MPAEFDTRITRFNETLFPEKVTEIVGARVSDAQRRYYRWLRFVAVAYLAVVIAAGVAAATIPHLVSHKHASRRMNVGSEAREVGPGDLVHVPPCVSHAIQNVGPDTLQYVSASSPSFRVTDLYDSGDLSPDQ